MVSTLVKRSFALSGHGTSVALEPEFWAVLNDEAARRHLSLAGLVGALDATRDPDSALASALRIYALNAVKRDRLTPNGGKP